MRSGRVTGCDLRRERDVVAYQRNVVEMVVIHTVASVLERLVEVVIICDVIFSVHCKRSMQRCGKITSSATQNFVAITNQRPKMHSTILQDHTGPLV